MLHGIVGMECDISVYAETGAASLDNLGCRPRHFCISQIANGGYGAQSESLEIGLTPAAARENEAEADAAPKRFDNGRG